MTLKRCISTGVLDLRRAAAAGNNNNNNVDDLLQEYDAHFADDDETVEESSCFSGLYTVSEDEDYSTTTCSSENNGDDDDDDESSTHDDESSSGSYEDDVNTEVAHKFHSFIHKVNAPTANSNQKQQQQQPLQKEQKEEQANKDGKPSFDFLSCPIQEVEITKSPTRRKKKTTIVTNDQNKIKSEQQRKQQSFARSLLLRTSISSEDFASLGQGMIVASNCEPGGSPGSNASHKDDHDGAVKPQETFVALLRKHGLCSGETSPFVSCEEVPANFFVRVTPEMIAAYDMDLATAVRQGDLNTVRSLHQFQDYDLQACNQFKESVVHVAARRGHAEVLSYLMDFAAINVRVCCDSGRTPLHDACWTGNPNFECIQLLLENCPDMMLIRDNRGYAPLSYVPREAWTKWNEFLDEHPHLVLPKILLPR